jgi:hypoxanthine-DNA glycosylase
MSALSPRGDAPCIAPRPAASERLSGLAPVIAAGTRLVVLGSFPGAASLAAGQYYGHPRNQFWPLLGAIWRIDLAAMPYEARVAEIARRGLGLWDVYAACRRQGSLDSAIREAEPNELARLRRLAPRLEAVAHNGSESARSAGLTAALGLVVHRLPSSSPANASWSFERKRAAWQAVLAKHGLAD